MHYIMYSPIDDEARLREDIRKNCDAQFATIIHPPHNSESTASLMYTFLRSSTLSSRQGRLTLIASGAVSLTSTLYILYIHIYLQKYNEA